MELTSSKWESKRILKKDKAIIDVDSFYTIIFATGNEAISNFLFKLFTKINKKEHGKYLTNFAVSWFSKET